MHMLLQLSCALHTSGSVDRMLVDGWCIIEPVLKNNVLVAVASYEDAFAAAQSLYQECVAIRSVGGMAGDIGKNE